MRQAKEDGGHEQRRATSHAPFQQVLQPSAKEEFFRNGDEEEGEEECAGKLRQMRPACVQMQKADAQPKGKRDGRIESKLAQADAGIAQAQAQIESNAIECRIINRP